MTDAPSCPISYGQPVPGARVFLKGEPWTRVREKVSAIPLATDLKSALAALRAINSAIMAINRGAPAVNNTHVPGEPDVTIPGEDHNPNYPYIDWALEGREYVKQRLYNPDDETQYIEIKTLKTVYFFNENTDHRLTYYSNL